MKHKRLQNKIIKLLEEEKTPLSTKQIADYLSTLNTVQKVKHKDSVYQYESKTNFWKQSKRVLSNVMKRKDFQRLGYDNETKTSIWGLRGVEYALD